MRVEIVLFFEVGDKVDVIKTEKLTDLKSTLKLMVDGLDFVALPVSIEVTIPGSQRQVEKR